MKKETKSTFIIAGELFLLFALLTVALLTIDVRPIGPEQSEVGLATINAFVLNLLGTNSFWDHITDLFLLAALVVALGFTVLGFTQLIKRRSLAKVDKSLVALGVLYGILAAFYMLFEVLVVNYRPIITDSGLEASYPSSHTLLVLCIMATAIIQLRPRLKNKTLRIAATIIFVTIITATVIGRLLSGVHWFTDILGSLLLGFSLIALYKATIQLLGQPKNRQTLRQNRRQ